MRRLLTTVAFSALVIGVAAPAWAADTSTTGASSGQTMSSDQKSKAVQTNPTTSSGQAMTGTSSTTDKAATKPTTKKKRAVHSSSARGADHSANELNRQELAKISGSGTTSYGSSGTAATGAGSPTK